MAQITKGKTFASGEVVTPQKMHDMVDLATVSGIVNADIDANAAIAASKLASTLDLSTRTVTLPAASVGTSVLVDASVTTVKVADRGITAGKLSGISTIEQKTANYTLVVEDRGKVIEVNSASALTITVPTNATAAFATGATVAVTRRGAGEVTIAGASGVTLRSDSSRLRIGKQYAAVVLIKIGTDEWMVLGNLKA